MSLRLAVPAKALARGKSRLAPALDAAARRALSRRFLDRVLEVAARCIPAADIQVISDGADALDVARAHGAATLLQSGRGLNDALDQARRAARDDGVSTLMVLPSDLPFLAARDVSYLIAAGTVPGALAVARDRRRQGTNALVLPAGADFRFRFGPGSAAAHIAEAHRCGRRPVAVDRPGIAFDVDTPEDHAAFLAAGSAAAPAR